MSTFHEVACIVNREGKVILWKDGKTLAVEDDASFWDAIWQNRDRRIIVAHTHPGTGPTGPSHEDVTTFASVEAALGKRLDWRILTIDHMAFCNWKGPGRLDYETQCFEIEPSEREDNRVTWADDLRRRSYR